MEDEMMMLANPMDERGFEEEELLFSEGAGQWPVWKRTLIVGSALIGAAGVLVDAALDRLRRRPRTAVRVESAGVAA